MSELTAAPFNYQFNDLVLVKAKSTNSFGTAPWSATNAVGAVISQVPSKMAAPAMVSLTTETMTVSWTPLLTSPANGNSQVLSYSLMWDNGSGTLSIELTDSLVTTYSVAGLTGGQTYSFKVAAVNIYGKGEYSDVTAIEASDVPA